MYYPLFLRESSDGLETIVSLVKMSMLKSMGWIGWDFTGSGKGSIAVSNLLERRVGTAGDESRGLSWFVEDRAD